MSIPIFPLKKHDLNNEDGHHYKYYATVKTSGEDTLDDVIRKVEAMSSASKADVYIVILSLMEVMQNSLEEGRIVRLGRLGSFRISVSSKGENDPSKINARSVEKARIIYKADKELKPWLERLKFRKVRG
jgi:predicted histone-like DNA-binding protein